MAGPTLQSQQRVAHPQGSPFAPVVASERIQNLDKFKDKLKQYHACTCTCGCYAKDLDAQADRAIAFLRRRSARRRSNEKLAVVLDIDETTLSNYQEMEKAGFAYDPKAFDAWEKLAQAPAIPGTLRLFNEAKRLGVSVFFLTGRGEAQQATTGQDLRAAGFDGWQGLILRPDAEASWTALRFKSAERKKLVRQGYTLVLNVGDQWSDLRADVQSDRGGAPEAEYSVKYPNPYYFIQ